MVLYGGRVMEQGSAQSIFYHPSHPYTVGLLGAIPRLDQGTQSLVTIPGAPPNMAQLPPGCPFSERCTLAEARCVQQRPVLAPGQMPDDGQATVLRACHISAAEVRRHARELGL
jgi:oligopeptide transport system ATP-binding protein